MSSSPLHSLDSLAVSRGAQVACGLAVCIALLGSSCATGKKVADSCPVRSAYLPFQDYDLRVDLDCENRGWVATEACDASMLVEQVTLEPQAGVLRSYLLVPIPGHESRFPFRIEAFRLFPGQRAELAFIRFDEEVGGRGSGKTRTVSATVAFQRRRTDRSAVSEYCREVTNLLPSDFEVK